MSNTTSQYISQINQSFPEPGKDNDSQVFRANFKNISNALYSANSEIDDLKLNSVNLTQENNFNSNLVKQAQFKDCSISVYDSTDTPITGDLIVDYTNGSYQKFSLASGTHNITVNNWPDAAQSGSLRLVLDADSELTTQVNFVANNLINISSADQPFDITTSTSHVFDLTSDGVVGTLFVQKVNSPILTLSTADSGSGVTTSSMFITFADNSNPGTVNKIEVASINNTLPYGSIIMWHGTIASIPSGWAWCDGTNGTPDLRNRFIVAASADGGSTATTYVTGSPTITGGNKDAIVVSHNHTATSIVTDPGHDHIIQISDISGASLVDQLGGSGADYGIANVADSGTTVGTTATGITVATTNVSAGTSGDNANLPPYYALAFIMKI